MDSYVKQFNKYYDETWMTVRKIAYRILKNVDDADDVTQEVFFKLFNYLKYSGEIKHLVPWLDIVTKRLAFDYLRTKRPVLLDNIQIEVPDTASRVVNSIIIQDAFRKLAEKNMVWYETVCLHYFLGIPINDVAKIMKCSNFAVHSYIYRSRKYLQNDPYFEDIHWAIIMIYMSELIRYIKFMN